MSDGRGFTALTPIADGRVDDLRDHLRGLPTGPRSPLTRVRGTHFARWAVVAFDGKDGRPQPGVPPHLLFSAEFDGELDAYAAALCRGLGADAHAIWSHCEGYPGEGELSDWLLRHRVVPGYSVVAYPGVTADQVRANLALRDRLNEFALKATALDPPALHRAWLQSFRSSERR